jgi:SM-20-related protein
MSRQNDPKIQKPEESFCAQENSLDYSSLVDDLTVKSWSFLSQKVSPHLCHDLYNHYMANRYLFDEAQIGNFILKKKDKSIRKSQIQWVEDWQQSSATIFLNEFYKELGHHIRSTFYIPLKWHESQIALYQQGDYYKKHLDQLKLTKHRQLTTVLFLNDCTQGGELVLYNKEDKSQVDLSILPKAGDLVIFFSAHIFHEVLPCMEDRMTLTTWLRDDAVPFLDSL